jgi:hypothetical protein
LRKHLKALVNRGGVAAHFQEDVDARAAGSFADVGYDVAVGGIEGFICAHLLGHFAAMGIYFGRK